LLTAWRVLNHCETIATVVRVGAFTVFAGSMVLAFWLCWVMYKSRKEGGSPVGL
jgi:hypothetical protein